MQPSTLGVPPALQRSGVVDALAARGSARNRDQGQQFAHRRSAQGQRVTEVDAVVGERLRAEMLGEPWPARAKQRRIGHQAVVVEGDVYPVGIARCLASNGRSLWL